jgi:hypothetical protein
VVGADGAVEIAKVQAVRLIQWVQQRARQDANFHGTLTSEPAAIESALARTDMDGSGNISIYEMYCGLPPFIPAELWDERLARQSCCGAGVPEHV